MRLLIFILFAASFAYAQAPPIEPGVSQELARWRAARYSDVRYKLNLTLEKMSPVLKGTMEIRVKLPDPPEPAERFPTIVLDWRKLKGYEDRSAVSNVSMNGHLLKNLSANAGGPTFEEKNEHLIFRDGVVRGENVIKLDFTSPILTSGSAITRYVDKEDGSEYIYSLFVPSDASTAFPVFDQPDLKARFWLRMHIPDDWTAVSNQRTMVDPMVVGDDTGKRYEKSAYFFLETKPISTYVFAFAAGPWTRFEDEDVPGRSLVGDHALWDADSSMEAAQPRVRKITRPSLYVRKSQAAKFRPHAKEVFRLNREAVKYFEQYFDYKFPFPKYDLVLIPEFPFGGMEHAGATFLRESSIIFPQEPTKNDHISRATLIFHETAHQWFGDTVTMRWFDDLWLKEGFATFMGYKALEKIMPEMNAWKVFYERIKQGAYQTDSTKGTTPIYQEIKNLSAAKSAYGNIVYNKAPAFLRQAEFYLGEDKFQTAVRAFLKKHEYANAGWEDLVKEFETASEENLKEWANSWVVRRGLAKFRISRFGEKDLCIDQTPALGEGKGWPVKLAVLKVFSEADRTTVTVDLDSKIITPQDSRSRVREAICYSTNHEPNYILYLFPNYQDYGYGIFLLDDKSREYVLKNIQNEKDPFLRSMMWGALWDSVREGELDPREYVELVVKILMQKPDREGGRNTQRADYALADARASASDDESTVALLLNRVGTAMNYYLSEPPVVTGGSLQTRLENLLIDRIRTASTLGQKITFYRAFLNTASTENARVILKRMLAAAKNPPVTTGGSDTFGIPLKTKDKFDIVTRLLILNDPDAPKLLGDLEKTETSDDAKRYAYAAKAGIPTAENKAKYWNDFVNNKEISESWIEAAFGPWNSIRHSELTLPYLQKALQELPNHKRNRKIFFVNGWLGSFIGGQRSEEALAIVNKFLADNPNLDKDLRLKILENVDLIERAVRIRVKYKS